MKKGRARSRDRRPGARAGLIPRRVPESRCPIREGRRGSVRPLFIYNPPRGPPPIDPASFVTAIITNGIGVVCCAVILWFMYYRETKTIPTLMTTFTETLAGIQKDNGKSLTLAQESFERRNKALLDTFGAMSREERQTCQKWHEENREDLRAILQEQKDTRHYIRNLANVAGLSKAADEAEQKLMEERGHAGHDSADGH